MNLTWDERFELAKAYYEYYGNLEVKSDFKTKNGFDLDAEGFNLGKWITAQRAQYRLNQLTPIHKQKLESIGMIFENINDLEWDKFYELAKIYFNYHGDLVISKDFRTINGYERNEKGKNLGSWFNVQRNNYNHQRLSQERQQKMQILFEMCEKLVELKWNKMYKLAKEYYHYYQNLNVSTGFKTINGYEYDGNGELLGKWIRKQRNNYKRKSLTEEKIEKLKKIGMVFENVLNSEWERVYGLAKNYYQCYGNLKIPRNFKTINGYEYDENGVNLGKWVNVQYNNYITGKLSNERFEKLKKIGMNFENLKKKRWEEMYSLAKSYYEHYHNLDVPTNFKTKNGYEEDEKGLSLGAWVNAQRTYHNQNVLSQEHKEKLQIIGMNFKNLYDAKWNQMYNLAKAYYEHYHNLDVPTNFKTKNGYEEDEKGFSLGAWVNAQRTYHNQNNLSEERIKRLESIGMNFKNLHHVAWEKMYNLAKSYYEHHHNLKLPKHFKTKNGYEFDFDGENLEYWITTQRVAYANGKLSQERIEKLKSIGMIFEIRKDKERNQLTCRAYGIDYKLHKKEIDSIPHREFIAKINYLNSQGIPFVIENKLHPIFFESNINMQVKYGINLEKLIQEYYPQEQIKGLRKCF